MPTVEAVCFDLDETLCLSERSDQQFLNEVFQRVDVAPIFSPADLRAIDPADLPPASNITEFYTNLYRTAVRRTVSDVDSESPLVEELGEAAGELYDPTAVTFREHAKEVLEYASDHYEVGLITNGREETQLAKLEQLGIAEVFDAVVICDPAAGIDGKPAREPFELVLSELSGTAATSLHVGDSHSEDVVGAQTAGLQSVWTPMNRPHEDVPADPDPAPTYRVDSLAELMEII